MSPHEELFHQLLDESSSLLAAPEGAGIAIPDDELHREIIVPLLPAMLADAAIRGHWSEQAATGFVARIGRHFENGESAPRWTPGDFEIHVTASYSAGPDARALADTLLSEESMRDMTAALMNQLLDALWPSLAPAHAAQAVPEEISAVVEIGAAEAVAAEIPPEKTTAPATLEIAESETAVPDEEKMPSAEFQAAHPPASRARLRALSRRLAAADVRRGLAANRAPHAASAAIVARRIFRRATPLPKRKRVASRTACLG